MRAAIVDEPGQVRVGEVPDPAPGAGEVVVRVGATGICGTDLHIAAGLFPPSPYPLVPGHEFSGEVVAVGADVPDASRGGVQVGDRVAVDPSLFCGRCRFCRVGRGNLCEHWGAVGDTVDGAFAEYVAVPAVSCYRMPESMTYRQGALVEPLSCAVHGLHRIGAEAGESFLVVGAGTMGLLLQQLLQRSGARVVVVDRNADRLPLAAQLGAAATATDIAELDGELFQAAVDVTGAVPAIEGALGALDRGGRMLVFGVAHADARAAVPPFRVYNDELSIIGSMAVLHSFGPAMELMASGAVVVDPLLTHALPLEEFPQALDLMRSGAGVKVQVLPGGA